MPLTFHDLQFTWQIPQGVWRWTTRMDLSGTSPTFQILNVVSPYGLLRDSIPLPGDVVQQMSASITKMVESFAPHILLDASAITLTLDEERGFGQDQIIHVTNNGAYGSQLGTSITSSAPYVKVTPANVGGLAAGSTGSFKVAGDSTNLLAIGSPYVVTLTVQDPSATNNPQTVTATLVVRPKATIMVAPSDVSFIVTGPVGGPWPSIPPQTFHIVNTGPGSSSLDFQIQRLTGNSPWIVNYTPAYGTIVGGATQYVTINVAPTLYMLPGTYEETLRVSGYSTNSYLDVLVSLTIA
jgi:hypothetical protein